MRGLWGYVLAAYGGAGALYGGYLVYLHSQARDLTREASHTAREGEGGRGRGGRAR